MAAPHASRPALWIGALAGLIAGGAALIGCGARTPELWAVNEEQVAATLDYDDALRTWTRSAESYEAFESRVFVTATFVSPAFAAAKARFEAERLGMDREAARAHRAEAVARASAETLLFVAVSTNDPYWNDLDRSEGSLRARLRLGDGSHLAPTSVKQLSSDEEADVRPFFPYLDPLYEAYWVRFPLPQDRDALRLRIAGAPAVVDLVWEAPLMRQEESVEAADGTVLSYTVEGEPGPVDFALADGIGCDGFIWRYIEPLLAERGRVLHLHMRGHGRSAQPRDPEQIGMEALADDWAAVFDACGTERAIVIGHSMGVQVALETWHRHPDRVAGLVLVCGSFENPVGTFHDGRALQRVLPLLQGAAKLGGKALERTWNRLVRLPVSFHVARLTEIHPDLTRRRDFEPYLEHLAAMNPSLFFRMLGKAGEHTARPYLQDIGVPVLVVAGSDDKFTPARLSDEMATRIPDARLLVCPEGTHTAPIEHPTLVNLHLGRFVDAVLARATGAQSSS